MKQNTFYSKLDKTRKGIFNKLEELGFHTINDYCESIYDFNNDYIDEFENIFQRFMGHKIIDFRNLSKELEIFMKEKYE